MTLRLARVLAPISVLGPGRRVVIWVQGCRLACPGCASSDTWSAQGGVEVAVAGLAEDLARVILEARLDGLTITGGEPTEQPDALAELVSSTRRLTQREGAPELDVLVFTGRELAAARAIAPSLLEAADTVVAGRYRRELPPANPLVASSNQTVTWRSAEARERYLSWCDDIGDRRVELAATSTDLLLVGLPAAGDLDRFRAALHDRGVLMDSVSWQL